MKDECRGACHAPRWLLALVAFVLFTFSGGYSAQAENTQAVSTTDGLIALLRQVVQKEYQIPAHDVLIIWADNSLEKELTKLGGRGLGVQIPTYDQEHLVGKPYLLLDVLENGHFKRKLSVKVKVDGWKDVYLTNQLVDKGEIFSRENVTKARKLISDLPKYFIQSADDVYGQEAHLRIQQGTVLTSRLVKERPLVFRGDQVKIQVVNGSLKLIAQGIAQEEGAKGQLIRIKILNFASEKIVHAQVIGTGEVRMVVQ